MDTYAIKKMNKAFSRRDFNQCINIFKKYFDDTSLDTKTAYMVGISYLYKYKFDLSEKYLKISLSYDNSNIISLMGLAAISLKRKNLEKATELYLKVLDIDADNKISNRVLNKLKNCDNINKLIRKMRFKDYVPIPPFYISFLSIFTLIMIVLVIIMLIIIFIYNIVS